MSASRAHLPELSEEQLIALLRQHAEPLPTLDDPHFADAFERYADARVVPATAHPSSTRPALRSPGG